MIEVTVRDGRASLGDAAGDAVLMTLKSAHRLCAGDHLTLPDGTVVRVLRVAEDSGRKSSGMGGWIYAQTVHIGDLFI